VEKRQFQKYLKQWDALSIIPTKKQNNYISNAVFSNNRILSDLNKIIHPAIKEDFLGFKKNINPDRIIIKESALLFETGAYKELDKTILVTAPLNLKIDRVMKRNSVSKKDVENRMANQWPDEKKIPFANFIITNNNQISIINQVILILDKIKQRA
jgi:dephospho-CoA kinase